MDAGFIPCTPLPDFFFFFGGGGGLKSLGKDLLGGEGGAEIFIFFWGGRSQSFEGKFKIAYSQYKKYF